MQKNLMIKDYIEKLSSKEAVPGGGSVAAIVGALSSALTSMVFNLTIGKKAFQEYSEEEKKLVYKASEKIVNYNNEFLEFMDKDGEGFLSLMSAFRLPKDTEEEKIKRKDKIKEGYENALIVPLNLARRCIELYECVFISAKYGSENVISDAGVAAILLQGAVESSVLNVTINLQGIEDKVYKNKIDCECREILKIASNRKIEIMDIVNSKIG
ncbi:cyclodeaminase/cyclohydrolase family protein [Clostridium sp. MB40-C1]|uniref:cyclodeaminase/cyclohydrolase family protein n=1 Tax=Clostridium sp. MB40-C1 TaxID=3070996 RepID=UPI0027DEACFD|nr:cyclodeaminase/cyclohydrolase family protein [Clostridium sp. MB40-C1]WMJ81198.1 cyclodeaminase/cyclohydrolase family protein [Clostridium sp. MB40-C1]